MTRTRTRTATKPNLVTWVLCMTPIDPASELCSFISFVKEEPRRLGKAIIAAGNELSRMGLEQCAFYNSLFSDLHDFAEAKRKYSEAGLEAASHSIFDALEEGAEWLGSHQDKGVFTALSFTPEMREYMLEGITAIYDVDKHIKALSDSKTPRTRSKRAAPVEAQEPTETTRVRRRSDTPPDTQPAPQAVETTPTTSTRVRNRQPVATSTPTATPDTRRRRSR